MNVFSAVEGWQGPVIDFFKNGDHFFLSTTILGFLFLFVCYEEVYKKLIEVTFFDDMIRIRSLIATKNVPHAHVASLKIEKLTTRFGLPNEVLKLKVNQKTYYISELYIKNYKEIKGCLLAAFSDKVEI